jgi:ABC-type multidrug transport system fused ATPase/permease subunit
MEGMRDDRTVGALFAELAGETTTLVRQELELARAEVVRGAATMASGAITVGVGGIVALMGIQVLLACAVLVGMLWLEPWQSALAVGGVVLLIGIVLMLVGRRRLDLRRLTPRRTIETLKQDSAWAKEQLNERL